MERLRHHDMDALLDFVLGTSAVRTCDQFADYVLGHLSRLARSDWTSYDEMIPAQSITKNLFNPSTVRAPEAWTALMHEHPMLAHYLRTEDGTAYKVTDFMTRSAFHRTALYNEVYRDTGVDCEIVIALEMPLPSVVGFGLGRAGRDFTERERILLNLARPHLTQAYRNATAWDCLVRASERADAALEICGLGHVRVRDDGRVLDASPRALQLIGLYVGPMRAGGTRLPDDVERWIQQSRGGLKPTVGSVPEPIQPFVVERAESRLVVRLIVDEEESLLVFEERGTTPGLPLLDGAGLTRKELEVLTWVSEGKTNREIGGMMRISERTVQKHLEHVFEKLGVETRAAATARLLRAPAAE